MIMKWRQIIPNLITVLAMLTGFSSILLTVDGMRLGSNLALYHKAAQLIMLAMVLDGLDGNVARWLRGRSEFGAELDTYVDLTAFGIAPALLMFAVTLQGEPIWRVVLPSAVTLSGVLRLARFKAKDPLRGQGGYAGLPITANAAWVAVWVIISTTPPTDRYSLNHGPVAVLFLVGTVIFITLQVSNIHYPKPTKKASLFALCLLLVGLLLYPDEQLRVRAAVSIIALGLVYICFGPLLLKGMAVHKARKEAREGGGVGPEDDTDGSGGLPET